MKEDFPIATLRSGVIITTFSGVFPGAEPSREGPVSQRLNVKTGLLFVQIELEASAGWVEVDVPPTQHIVLYVMQGSIVVGESDEEAVEQDHLSFLSSGEVVRVMSSSSGSTFLLLTAPRVREPVFVSGGFVSGNERGIQDAFDDLRDGRSTHC
jgi:redox-sensitive bicupin YhaK (pirin superfamily)